MGSWDLGDLNALRMLEFQIHIKTVLNSPFHNVYEHMILYSYLLFTVPKLQHVKIVYFYHANHDFHVNKY